MLLSLWGPVQALGPLNGYPPRALPEGLRAYPYPPFGAPGGPVEGSGGARRPWGPLGGGPQGA